VRTEAVLSKATAVSHASRIRTLQDRLYRASLAEWNETARGAIARTLATTPNPKEPWTADDADRIADRLINNFRGWMSRDLQKLVGEVNEEIYGSAKSLALNRVAGHPAYQEPVIKVEIEWLSTVPKGTPVEAIPSFTSIDYAAIGYYNETQVFWMKEHFDSATVAKIRLAAKKELRGKTGVEAGRSLRVMSEKAFGVGAFSEMGKDYFYGVAVNASTTARVSGSIRTFAQLGVTRYEIVNPMDERTTDICSHMHGKTMEVKDAVSTLDQLVAAKTPAQVKQIHGWHPHDFKQRFASMGVPIVPGKDFPSGSSAKVAAGGFAFPPFHFRCRSTVDVSTATVYVPQTIPTPKIPKPVIPKPKAPKPVTPPTVLPPTPKPVPPPPTPPQAAVFPHSLDDMKALPSGGLGGMHSKVLLEAPDGSRWLYKPYTHRKIGGMDQSFRAWGDKAASDFAAAIDFPGAEVHVVTLPADHAGLSAMGMRGKPVLGSIQRMADDITGEIGATSLETLSSRQLLHAQKEHVYDWLISNHDGHGANLLMTKQGGLFGIDKGQTFRYFGRDSLWFDYNPNSNYGVVSYYNQQFRRYAEGAAGREFELLGPKANAQLRQFITQIQDMGDDQFLAIFNTYADEASKAGVRWAGMGRDEFLQALLQRKKNLLKEFDKFYGQLEQARRKALGIVGPAPKKPRAPATFTKLTGKFTKEVHESGLHGKSAFVGDVHGVEGGNVLYYGMRGDGTIAELYLTEAGHVRFMEAIGEASTARLSMPSVAADPYFDNALKVTKSLVAHLGDEAHHVFDGKIPPHTWTLLRETWESVDAAVEAGMDNAAHYLKHLQTLTGLQSKPLQTATPVVEKILADNAKAFVKAGKQLKRYAPPSSPTPALGKAGSSAGKKGAKAFDTSKVPTREWNVRLEDGQVRFVSFQGEVRGSGGAEMITINVKGTSRPVRLEYIRRGDSNLRSKEGRLRLVLDKDSAKLKPKDLKEVNEILEQFGVRSQLAAKEDLEAIYLMKVTRAAKLSKSPEFAVAEGMTSSEIIDKLGKAWSKRLGVKDVRKIKPYQWKPVLDQGRAEYGKGWWKRFDITKKDLDKHGLTLDHSLWHGSPVQFFEQVLPGKTHALITTEMKQRIGIPLAGMSPESDMATGGARYAFTRVRSRNFGDYQQIRSRNIRFSNEVMLDADAIAYNSDEYGNTAYFWEKHQPGVAEFRGMVNRSSNEMIIQNHLSFDHIEEIGSPTHLEKEKLIELFKRHGIEDLGGRKLDDVIKVGSGY
jgi:hypothetical protein